MENFGRKKDVKGQSKDGRGLSRAVVILQRPITYDVEKANTSKTEEETSDVECNES
jgi:hypothetical protein